MQSQYSTIFQNPIPMTPPLVPPTLCLLTGNHSYLNSNLRAPLPYPQPDEVSTNSQNLHKHPLDISNNPRVIFDSVSGCYRVIIGSLSGCSAHHKHITSIHETRTECTTSPLPALMQQHIHDLASHCQL